MEWSEAHDILLAREVLASEPFRFKSRTVERGKVWQDITDRLNGTALTKFRVTKRSTRDHFNLLLTKYKAKRRTEAKLSGVDVEDTELDTAMEEIWEKWEAAEEENSLHSVRKKEADRVGGEDVRMKACEKLGETMKRKSEASATDQKPRKSRRSGGDTIAFLRERAQQDIVLKQQEQNAKQREQERQTQLYEQFVSAQQQQQQQQTQMMQVMQQQNQAMLELITKFAQK